MKRGLIIGLAVASIAGVAGYLYYSKQVKLLQNSLTYKLISFSIGTVTETAAQVFLTMRIFSSSTLDADIQELYTDVYLNGILVGNVQNLDKFILPAKGYSDVNLTVTFSPRELLMDALKLVSSFLNAKDFFIKVQGFIKIKMVGFINMSVPFTYDTSLHEIMQPSVVN